MSAPRGPQHLPIAAAAASGTSGAGHLVGSDDDQLMIETEIFRGPSGLARVADDWDRILAETPHRSLYHLRELWESAAGTIVPDPESLVVLQMRRGGAPAAIALLQRSIRSRFGVKLRQWHVPKHVEVPPRGFLAAPGVSGAEIVAAIKRTLRGKVAGGWDVLSLSGVLDAAPVSDVIASPPGLSIVGLRKTCDAIVCGATYEDMLAGFSRNFRSNLSKARNKLAKEAEVEFRSTTDPARVRAGFDEFVEIEASGWKGAKGSGTAMKLHPEVLAYYRRLLDRLAGRGVVVSNCLRVGGRPIASQMCLKVDGTLHLYKLAYDEAWARVAPGNMLLEWVVKKGIAEGDVKEVDILGNPRWFRDWRPVSRNVHDVHLFNTTPVGLAVHAAMRAKPRIAALRARLARGPVPGEA